jgi:hypothetical protein
MAIADNPGMSLPRAIVPGRRYMITSAVRKLVAESHAASRW